MHSLVTYSVSSKSIPIRSGAFADRSSKTKIETHVVWMEQQQNGTGEAEFAPINPNTTSIGCSSRLALLNRILQRVISTPRAETAASNTAHTRHLELIASLEDGCVQVGSWNCVAASACSKTIRLQDGFSRSSSRDHRPINRGGFSMVTTDE